MLSSFHLVFSFYWITEQCLHRLRAWSWCSNTTICINEIVMYLNLQKILFFLVFKISPQQYLRHIVNITNNVPYRRTYNAIQKQFHWSAQYHLRSKTYTEHSRIGTSVAIVRCLDVWCIQIICVSEDYWSASIFRGHSTNMKRSVMSCYGHYNYLQWQIDQFNMEQFKLRVLNVREYSKSLDFTLQEWPFQIHNHLDKKLENVFLLCKYAHFWIFLLYSWLNRGEKRLYSNTFFAKS